MEAVQWEHVDLVATERSLRTATTEDGAEAVTFRFLPRSTVE